MAIGGLKRRNHCLSRCGFSALDLVVACSIAMVGLSVIATQVVRSKLLVSSMRDEQCAIESISNVMERLTAVNPPDFQQFVAQSELLDEVKKLLTDCQINSKLTDDEDGKRIRLQLSWRDRSQATRTILLTGWLDRQTSDRSAETSTTSPELVRSVPANDVGGQSK